MVSARCSASQEQEIKKQNIISAKIGFHTAESKPPTNLLFDIGSRALIWDRFYPWRRTNNGAGPFGVPGSGSLSCRRSASTSVTTHFLRSEVAQLRRHSEAQREARKRVEARAPNFRRLKLSSSGAPRKQSRKRRGERRRVPRTSDV